MTATTTPLPPSYGYGITDSSLATSGFNIFSAAVPIVGGILSAKAGKQAQKRAIRFAREQMRFQERMSNTAYTRAARDLDQAGLNRILALGKPATTPQGAMPPTIQSEQQGINTALQLRRQQAEIQAIEATTAKTRTETQNISERTTTHTLFERRAVKLANDLATARTDSERQNVHLIRERAREAGFTADQAAMLTDLYRAEPKLMIGQDVQPWFSMAMTAVGMAAAGFGVAGVAGRAFRAYRATGGKMGYQAFKKWINDMARYQNYKPWSSR